MARRQKLTAWIVISERIYRLDFRARFCEKWTMTSPASYAGVAINGVLATWSMQLNTHNDSYHCRQHMDVNLIQVG